MKKLMDDETYAEFVLAWGKIGQPESLERFVRAARRDPSKWAAAANNAIEQRDAYGWRTEWPDR